MLSLFIYFSRVGHGHLHIFRIWRNIAGISNSTSLTADPVLGIAKFSRAFFLTAHTFHKYSVCFFNQTIAKRKFIQTFDGKFCGTDTIYHIGYILIGIFIPERVENIIQSALRTFNL